MSGVLKLTALCLTADTSEAWSNFIDYRFRYESSRQLRQLSWVESQRLRQVSFVCKLPYVQIADG